MEPLISIIVPIYNAEWYIQECINSIQQQTYSHLEIILVDDGSTDQSYAISQRLSEEDNRIKLYSKDNGGAGSAKNFGIERATGEYIMIVDADDVMDSRCIKLLLDELIQQKADIAIGDYYVYNENSQLFYYYVLEKDYKREVITPEQAINRQLEGAVNPATYIVPWVKLYKRELFYHVRFPENGKFDDEQTTHRLYLNAEKIAVVVDNLYLYRTGQPSEMRAPFTLQWVRDLLRTFDLKISDCVLAGIDTSIVKRRFQNILYEYKYMMEEYQLTHELEYQTILYRIQLLEKERN